MIKLANKISDETIEYVGILAKLELSEEEKRSSEKRHGADAGLYRYIK